MAVSKRLRFEILRRDNHTCQYCGEKAPDVTLHVDHVKPKSLGGNDGPENLVTACKDCNVGKTSASIDAPLVEAIAQRNLDWEVRAATLNAQMRGTLEQDKLYKETFDYYWSEGETATGESAPLPYGYEASIFHWAGMGVPEDVLVLDIKTAFAAYRVAPEGRFKYLAGVIWNQIKSHEIDLEPREKPALYTEGDLEDHWRDGWQRGENSTYKKVPMLYSHYNPLTAVVDRLTTSLIEKTRWVP